MSAPPPRSSTPPIGSRKVLIGTPKRINSIARSQPGPTPPNQGSSSRKGQEGNTDRDEKFAREDYDDYIREDLHSRVFVDFEVFLKSVLHAPNDWRAQWGPAIEKVKANENFKARHEKYCQRCGDTKALEKMFYDPLMDTANAVLDVVSRPEFNDISESGNPQYYRVSNTKSLRGGVMNKKSLSPDLVVLHEDLKPPPGKNLHWANALHVLEVKPSDAAICDGMNMPRLIVDGADPILNHALPHSPARYQPRGFTPPTDPDPAPALSTKRNSAEPSSENPRASKKPRTRSVLTGVNEEDEDSDSSEPKPETKAQYKPATQVCRYLLEMFSIPLLRSHATVCLVDRDRLQLYHANRSVILVSSAINFSSGDGLDKFIAVVIAFRRLSYGQNGILDTLAEKNVKLLKDDDIPLNNKIVQSENQLELTTTTVTGSEESFTVTLGEVISRDPATIGRSTVVLRGKSKRWPCTDLVVKISCPGAGRVPEDEFLRTAVAAAKEPGEEWAIKHLPHIVWSGDVIFGADSTLESVATLFENAKFEGRGFEYERRALRIIIQEKLYPLKSLQNAKELGQAFVDTACIHRWLYDKPGILHRDLSLNNIMCRIINERNARGRLERKVYGVLTDFDLSSWIKDLRGDYTKTSQHRTGTPPYMAQELLGGTSATHLYRHDLESLFHIMLLVCGRHTFGYAQDGADGEMTLRMVMRRKNLPYQDWFNEQNYNKLGALKAAFFSNHQAVKLSPPFKDFRPWLEEAQLQFAEGFAAKVSYTTRQLRRKYRKTPADDEKYDDETLGGHIDYFSFTNLTKGLEGDLEGLAIRYSPSPSLTRATDNKA